MKRCECGHSWEPEGDLVRAMLACCPACGKGPPEELRQAWEKFQATLKEFGFGLTPYLPIQKLPEPEPPTFQDLMLRYGPGTIRSEECKGLGMPDYHGIVDRWYEKQVRTSDGIEPTTTLTNPPEKKP